MDVCVPFWFFIKPHYMYYLKNIIVRWSTCRLVVTNTLPHTSLLHCCNWWFERSREKPLFFSSNSIYGHVIPYMACRYPKIDFSISKNDFWISKNDLWISKNRFFDIEKWFLDIEKWFLDIQNSIWFIDIEKWILDIEKSIFRYRKMIYGYRKMIFRYRKIIFDIDKSFFDIEKSFFDIDKSFFDIHKWAFLALYASHMYQKAWTIAAITIMVLQGDHESLLITYSSISLKGIEKFFWFLTSAIAK